MGLAAAQRALMIDTVQLAPRTSTSADREKAYGADVAVPARVEYGPRQIQDAQGRVVVSSVRVFIPADEVTASVTDRLTLPGGAQPVLLRVDRSPDALGAHHQVLYA
jgi:hypothetical protein